VNSKQWPHFSNYIESLITIQQKSLEQADNEILLYRSQGAIAVLKKMQQLKNDVVTQDVNI
jgi:hypothetical protein